MTGKRPFDQLNRPESTTTPPMLVPWPPMYLVAECSTMSAPHSMGTAQVRGREGVVDEQRQSVLVRDGRDRLDVEHVAAGVADRLREKRLGVVADRGLPCAQVVGIDPRQLDTQLAQHVLELVDRAAVQGR